MEVEVGKLREEISLKSAELTIANSKEKKAEEEL